MKYRGYLLASLCALVLAMTACGTSPSSRASSPSGTNQQSTTLTYTDATHTTVTLKQTPKRIVCLVSACEDILAELGITPVAVNDTLAQDPHFFGAAGRAIPKIGGSFFDPNVEDIAKAMPDLVIGLANVHERLRDALQPIAPLYIMNPVTYNDSISYLKDIGRLTGKSAAANRAARRFLAHLAAYKAKSPKNVSTVLIYGSDQNFNVFTQGTLFGSLISQVTSYPLPAPGAGAAPASDHEPGAIPYSVDKLLALNPDTLLIASFGGGPGTPPLAAQLAANPAWSHLKAVQDHRVYEINPSYYIFGRGTRSLSLALDDAMTKLYPKIFPEPLQS